MKKNLSIVIVAYNSHDLIIDTLDSIYKTCKKNSFEVIISDNSPNALTKEILEKTGRMFPNLTYIKNNENLGFSKGNNVGIRKSSGEYLLFLNPDTRIYENTLDGMLEFIREHKDAGAAGCFVELPSGALDDSSHRGFPTPWRAICHFSGLSKIFPKSKLFAGYNMTYLDLSKTHEVDSLAGSFMLIPRFVGDALSWWDEDYFFYGDDLDFCYRIRKAGYKIYFVPQFRALHYKGISSGIKSVSKEITKASRETKIKATGWRFDAMRIFYDKHYKNKYPSIVRNLMLMGIAVKKFSALCRI